MFPLHVTKRLTRLLLCLSSTLALLKGVQALKFSHVSSTGEVFLPFWLVFLCLSTIGTVVFVIGYMAVINRRRIIIRRIFASPEYELLEDYDNIATDSDWKNLGIIIPRSQKEEVATPENEGGLTPDTPKTKKEGLDTMSPRFRSQDVSKSRSKERSIKPPNNAQNLKSPKARKNEQNSKSDDNRLQSGRSRRKFKA
ncbi:hypothetical protein ANCCAN_06763 [Ancylostoma caninum]|uniref:Uncharacterized protein n=1 Tax=Ancylostoma caninum TaxID=29170 RepID=A0A368GS41_ANCCA|nr:hypothetical protein ANCCAN_06763 [Ancylostoma caninum]